MQHETLKKNIKAFKEEWEHLKTSNSNTSQESNPYRQKLKQLHQQAITLDKVCLGRARRLENRM